MTFLPEDLLATIHGRAAEVDATNTFPDVDLADLRDAGATVLLPDEPYPFTRADADEALPGVPVRLVEGRLLFWYGPSLVDAARLDLLASQV